MKKIEWNKVTWYSKLAAVIVFVATFVVAFNLGVFSEEVHIETALSTVPGAGLGGTAGAHCGGFIRNAPTCAAGYHCQLKVSNPDTGGICVRN